MKMRFSPKIRLVLLAFCLFCAAGQPKPAYAEIPVIDATNLAANAATAASSAGDWATGAAEFAWTQIKFIYKELKDDAREVANVISNMALFKSIQTAFDAGDQAAEARSLRDIEASAVLAQMLGVSQSELEVSCKTVYAAKAANGGKALQKQMAAKFAAQALSVKSGPGTEQAAYEACSQKGDNYDAIGDDYGQIGVDGIKPCKAP